MVFPAVLLVFVFGIFPVGFALYVSLHKWRLKKGDFLGLDNYVGSIDNLTYVAPKSGRAVSKAAAGEWAERLLPLSPALIVEGDGSVEDLLAGLRVSGHFLDQRLAPSLGERPIPAARNRLVDLIARTGGD